MGAEGQDFVCWRLRGSLASRLVGGRLGASGFFKVLVFSVLEVVFWEAVCFFEQPFLGGSLASR